MVSIADKKQKKKSKFISTSRRKELKHTFYLYKNSPMFIFGTVLVGIIIFLAIAAPFLHSIGIIPFKEGDYNYSQKYLPPLTVDNRTYGYWDDSIVFTDPLVQGQIRVTVGSLHGNDLVDIIYGDPSGNLYYISNEGNNTNLLYETRDTVLINDDVSSPMTVDGSAQPWLADLNGDDLNDLVVGTENGSIYYSINNAVSNEPIWSPLQPFSSGGSDIQVGSKASPTIYDIDKDGLLDLIIGSGNGELYFYKNAGNTTHWTWTLVATPSFNYVSPEIKNGFSSPIYPSVTRISENSAHETIMIVSTINDTTKAYFFSATRREIYNKEYREVTSTLEITIPEVESLPGIQALGAYDVDDNGRMDLFYFDNTGNLHVALQLFTVDGRLHLLGLNKEGGDLFSYCLWALRLDLIMALWIVAAGIVIGVILGSLAGYYGGKIDTVVMRITDVFYAFPSIILAMAIASVLGRNMFNLGLSLIAVWWTGYTRLIRAQVLVEREKTYVEAARAQGFSNLRILFRHILPNSWYPILVNATLDLGAVTLNLAGLSFIGFGAQPGEAELGRMIAEGRMKFPAIPGLTFFPGLFIFIMVMGWNLVGDGLRDVLDPQLRR